MPRNNSKERRNERRQAAVDRMRKRALTVGRALALQIEAEADRVEQLVVRERRGWTE